MAAAAAVVVVVVNGGAGGGGSEATEHRLWSRLCNAANVRPSHEIRPLLPSVPLAG